MAEHIEREALLSLAEHQYVTYSEVLNVPAADVAPVVHGRWDMHDTSLGLCCTWSVCGSNPTMQYRFCPYCGARMDGDSIDK